MAEAQPRITTGFLLPGVNEAQCTFSPHGVGLSFVGEIAVVTMCRGSWDPEFGHQIIEVIRIMSSTFEVKDLDIL